MVLKVLAIVFSTLLQCLWLPAWNAGYLLGMAFEAFRNGFHEGRVHGYPIAKEIYKAVQQMMKPVNPLKGE